MNKNKNKLNTKKTGFLNQFQTQIIVTLEFE